MKRFLNTLFITTQNSYLSKELDTIIIKNENGKTRIPLLTLESIVCFGNVIASPFILGECAKRGINVAFLTEYGKFLWRVSGKTHGNVLLRREHYRKSESLESSLTTAKNMITAKTINSKIVLDRALRDHSEKIDKEKIKKVSVYLKENISNILECDNLESLRGIEGSISRSYFSVFNEMILQQKTSFNFSGRNRRPPLDPVNALLSFAYTILHHDVVSALESVGLDSAVGFFHKDRSGRMSLALDMMEEFRAFFADRLVLSLINRKEINAVDFEKQKTGAVLMNDKSRKIFLKAYQERKKDIIEHPYVNKKMHIGILFHTQAILLARYIRGDMEEYPPYFWR